MKSILAFVFHSHLPFIRHPEYEYFLEEDWLFEAISETYIPFLLMCEELDKKNIEFRFTMSLTPTLLEMLNDSLLQSRYVRHLENLRELIDKEIERLQQLQDAENQMQSALMYKEMFEKFYDLYVKRCNCDMISQFKYWQDKGKIEIITCTATHIFSPFVTQKQALIAQIRQGVRTYKKYFGCKPKGIWLAECAYFPELDELLVAEGIKYTLLDTHAVEYAEPSSKFNVHRPVQTQNGLKIFARDRECSRQIWSSKEGYPGDPNYREFYKDIGWDLDKEYLAKFIKPSHIRKNLGIKYHKITGEVDLGEKEFYVPEVAFVKASEHSRNFLFNRQKQAEFLENIYNAKPVIVAPFDAELFGHWWFEGHKFLQGIFEELNQNSYNLETKTLSEVLALNEVQQNIEMVEPLPSSWGDKGFYSVWCNGSNCWMYQHLSYAQQKMIEKAYTHPKASGLLERYLNQMARELMLAESSDWAFITTTGTVVEFAEGTFTTHIKRFEQLLDAIENGELERNLETLMLYEEYDNIFSDMNYRIYIENFISES